MKVYWFSGWRIKNCLITLTVHPRILSFIPVGPSLAVRPTGHRVDLSLRLPKYPKVSILTYFPLGLQQCVWYVAATSQPCIYLYSCIHVCILPNIHTSIDAQKNLDEPRCPCASHACRSPGTASNQCDRCHMPLPIPCRYATARAMLALHVMA
jgi:hypothetical protein